MTRSDLRTAFNIASDILLIPAVICGAAAVVTSSYALGAAWLLLGGLSVYGKAIGTSTDSKEVSISRPIVTIAPRNTRALQTNRQELRTSFNFASDMLLIPAVICGAAAVVTSSYPLGAAWLLMGGLSVFFKAIGTSTDSKEDWKSRPTITTDTKEDALTSHVVRSTPRSRAVNYTSHWR